MTNTLIINKKFNKTNITEKHIGLQCFHSN